MSSPASSDDSGSDEDWDEPEEDGSKPRMSQRMSGSQKRKRSFEESESDESDEADESDESEVEIVEPSKARPDSVRVGSNELALLNWIGLDIRSPTNSPSLLPLP